MKRTRAIWLFLFATLTLGFIGVEASAAWKQGGAERRREAARPATGSELKAPGHNREVFLVQRFGQDVSFLESSAKTSTSTRNNSAGPASATFYECAARAGTATSGTAATARRAYAEHRHLAFIFPYHYFW